MNSRFSALLGALVGLALAAVLLVPSASREILLAQGLQHLLDGHRAAAAEEATLFARLDALARQAPPAWNVRLEVRQDGELLDHDAFGRAFTTRLNEFNQEVRPEPADGAEPAPEERPLRVGDAGPLLVELELRPDGPHLALAAAVSRDGAREEVVVPAGGYGGGEHPERVRLPDRTSLVPPLLAILVALVLRKTLMALFLGILAGAVLLAHQGGAGWFAAAWQGLLDVPRVYLLKELVDTFRVEIIGFVIALVAMVGVMSRAGGVQGLIQLLLGFARTVRSTLFVTWGMGVLIFFDDYANCLLVGNTMRPLSDRLRISREKLAYIVDSTAAPIAGISLLSTWIAYEVSTFSNHLPAAGITEDAYEIFLRTIPFRYYCLFTLSFVFLSILTGRDYGPMRTAEKRARSTGQLVREGGTPMVSDEATRIEPREGMPGHWWHAAMPILLVLVGTLASIFHEGGGFAVLAEAPGDLLKLETITGILFDGSGGKPIFLGASAGFALAVFLSGSNIARAAVVGGLLAGHFGAGHVASWIDGLSLLRATPGVEGAADPWYGRIVLGMLDYVAYAIAFVVGAGAAGSLFRLAGGSLATTRRAHLPGDDITNASLASTKALFFAVIILFEAWMIGSVCADIGTADYLVALLSGSVSAVMLPVLLFLAACLVAFATGSSWSTMAILLPNVVALAASVGEAEGLGALTMVVLCIGAVLEGSIFGDHCSPISDTTVLSSVSSASDHIDHVRTQAPYALTTAGVAIVFGYLPTVAFDWYSTPHALATGLAAILAVLYLVGRPTPPAAEIEVGS